MEEIKEEGMGWGAGPGGGAGGGGIKKERRKMEGEMLNFHENVHPIFSSRRADSHKTVKYSDMKYSS